MNVNHLNLELNEVQKTTFITHVDMKGVWLFWNFSQRFDAEQESGVKLLSQNQADRFTSRIAEYSISTETPEI